MDDKIIKRVQNVHGSSFLRPLVSQRVCLGNSTIFGGIGLLCALFLLLLSASSSLAAETHKVGFRTLGFWISEHNMRLDINVWYPGTRAGRELNYSPYTITAARDCKPLPGKYPLLVLSHPSHGTRFSFHDTCSYLASRGFVVAAPTHAKDCMNNMDLLFTWEQLSVRALEIQTTITLLLEHKELSPSIDVSSIGVLGFGSGGTTALLLAGALPNCISWPEYCPKAGKHDLYCNPWSRERINAICTNFPLKRSLLDPRITAICAVSPGFGMLFSAHSFEHFATPLLLLVADTETLNQRALHADTFARYLHGKARLVTIPGADVGALMAPCPESLERELSDLCRSVSPKERVLIHKRMWDILESFFGGDSKKETTAQTTTP